MNNRDLTYGNLPSFSRLTPGAVGLPAFLDMILQCCKIRHPPPLEPHRFTVPGKQHLEPGGSVVQHMYNGRVY